MAQDSRIWEPAVSRRHSRASPAVRLMESSEMVSVPALLRPPPEQSEPHEALFSTHRQNGRYHPKFKQVSLADYKPRPYPLPALAKLSPPVPRAERDWKTPPAGSIRPIAKSGGWAPPPPPNPPVARRHTPAGSQPPAPRGVRRVDGWPAAGGSAGCRWGVGAFEASGRAQVCILLSAACCLLAVIPTINRQQIAKL